MSSRRAMCFVFALASSLTNACWVESDDECTGWTWRSPERGERLEGIDPFTVFDIYDQTWSGLIHWRSGESAQLKFTPRFVASKSVVVTMRCGKPGRLDQSLPAELESEDGLFASLDLGVSVRLPEGGPAFDAPNILVPEVTLGPRGDAILAGLTNVDDWRVTVDLFWLFDSESGRPTMPDNGVIRAIGTMPVVSAGGESIEVATLDFDRRGD